jgi:SAM-dependent methyltransferase
MLEPGICVLDCGCGTDDMLAIIARLTAPGEACGGDLSEAMLREARQRLAATGATNLRFESMDVQSLPHFVAHGSMSETEANTLFDDLANRSANGHFFAASTFHTVSGQRV